MQYPDKLGCYRVGDLKFYSKLEAIEMHAKTGIHPHWDFNESVFDSYDWTVEPSENILELYKARAEQLRSNYDYIVLLYSGGADSETVLQSFFNNNIKLDELVSYTNYSATGDRDNFLNAEVFRVVVPRIDQIREKWPWIKHRVIDLSELTMQHFDHYSSSLDWFYNMNMFFTPNCVARDGLANKIQDWVDIMNSGKRLCVLWGHDKPRILHENNKYSVRFMDLIDNGPTVKSIAGQQPYTDELFFWTPDLPKIIIKQAHLIKRYLETHLDHSLWISNQRSDLAYREVNGKKYWLSHHGMHQIIYPNWNIDTFSAGKPGSIFFSPRDTWFIELNNSYRAKHVWEMGINKLWALIPDYWKNDPADCYKGLKACWSKDYYLE
jgi:hypothetical protein